jgi:DNA-binding response OmpR family regulator
VIAKKKLSASTARRLAVRVPLVLMGENTSQQAKMLGIQAGAADFLEKPLSALKLRNIWQHTVRKVTLRASPVLEHHRRCRTYPGLRTLVPGQQIAAGVTRSCIRGWQL